MPVKTALCLHLQPTRLSCQTSEISIGISLAEPSIATLYHLKGDSSEANFSISEAQRGASSFVLALFVAAVLVTVSVGLIFGHKIGYQRGYHALEAQNKLDADSGKLTSEQVNDLRLTQKVLSNQVATAKQELTISLNNLDELRDSQKELDTENQQLNQLNKLYAELISDKGGMPLQILGAKIKPLPENAFEYGFDVGMLSKSGQSKPLNVTLTLLNDNDFVEVPLDPARYSIKGIVRIRGRFEMPTGFKPMQAKLVLEAAGQKVEQLYDWKLGEMVDSMPLSLLDLPDVDQSPIE